MRHLLKAAVLAATALGPIALPAPASAQVALGLSIRIGYAPPPLLVYSQPPIPAPNYVWVPGYWAWSDWADDYVWVAGYWARAPQPGLLWTPAWWGWDDGVYLFHAGYWGPTVGFYGGINYGYGYVGSGWQGGFWRGGTVVYNRSVTNVTNVNVVNVYNRPVTNVNVTRVSYNGGNGGVVARPTPQQIAAMHEVHVPPTAEQARHFASAQQNPRARAAALNPGWRPPATRRVDAAGRPVARPAALAAPQPRPALAPAARPMEPALRAPAGQAPASAAYPAEPRDARRGGGQPPQAFGAERAAPPPMRPAQASRPHPEMAPRPQPQPHPQAMPPRAPRPPQPRHNPAPPAHREKGEERR